MTTVSHLTTGWYHENALRALGITADVTYSAGRVVVSLSDDDLDRLVEMTTEHYRCDVANEKAVEAAHGAGEEVGREEGYEQAVNDLDQLRDERDREIRALVGSLEAFESPALDALRLLLDES